MSGGLALRGGGRGVAVGRREEKKKEIPPKNVKKKMQMYQIYTCAFGSFSLSAYRLRECFKCVFMDQIYGLMGFFNVLECPPSCCTPHSFYVNLSYQRFSLQGLAVLCERLDSHSSLFLFLSLACSLAHTERPVSDVCVGCWGCSGRVVLALC